ncbi:beta-carotene 3-hydroxylase [Chitinophaga arvensicola]|uniref:Beta-carotene 3-hydroxylase n=2 Tax=Chitinophaga arvensicola TaxID=29529 RepID=A0A1I0R6K9_9BACT|nr:beta-carotene 3-hydroxylase [Chitinophaga arvensicola]
MMIYLLYALLIIATFCFMEGVAWFTHKYLMHGPLWYLHQDHHRPEPGWFEKNDAFFVIFAAPSIALFFFGWRDQLNWMFFMGLGIFLYGMAYFLVHDIIIHQRFKWLRHSDNTYIKAIRRAHKMHHKHLSKHDGESFGMLYVARKYRDAVRKEKKSAHAN